MAIDADLNAGIIDQDTAEFGELKFLKSRFFRVYGWCFKVREGRCGRWPIDFANQLNWRATIGIIQYDLSFEDAARVYVLLIGDGQCPIQPSFCRLVPRQFTKVTHLNRC